MLWYNWYEQIWRNTRGWKCFRKCGGINFLFTFFIFIIFYPCFPYINFTIELNSFSSWEELLIVSVKFKFVEGRNSTCLGCIFTGSRKYRCVLHHLKICFASSFFYASFCFFFFEFASSGRDSCEYSRCTLPLIVFYSSCTYIPITFYFLRKPLKG